METQSNKPANEAAKSADAKPAANAKNAAADVISAATKKTAATASGANEGAKPAAGTVSAPANEAAKSADAKPAANDEGLESNVAGVLGKTGGDFDDQQKKPSLNLDDVYQQETLSYLRDAFLMSTPDQRRQLINLINEFETVPYSNTPPVPLESSSSPNIVTVNQQVLSDDEKSAIAHQDNILKYGEGYVKAKKGEETTVFSHQSWKMLSKDKDGWKRVVDQPKEVKDLK